MCGIFGFVGPDSLDSGSVKTLVKHAQQRGRDSSGMVVRGKDAYNAYRADLPIDRLLKRIPSVGALFFGHSRLVTNGTADNQPVMREQIVVLHNGIVVNHTEVWPLISKTPELEIDTEVIPAIIATHLEEGGTVETAAERVLELTEGVVACAALIPRLGKLLLFSNNGSLFLGDKSNGVAFSSESYPLEQLGAENIRQVRDAVILEVPAQEDEVAIVEWANRSIDLVPGLGYSAKEESLLQYPTHNLRRCTRCILPETMPYIAFDEDGVCNYCLNYKPRNHPRPKEELFELIEPYRRSHGDEVVVPFSGGRDSSYGLHLIIHELKLRPITYTYDWGMVTDLGRRNVSRMSAQLGVENIIVAPDITKKRDYIRRNLTAWLKSPHLGMLSVLTAGDKHFFRHVETIKRQTGISLNLWGINPLEVTHFKSGFLGVPPDFAEERVYSHGAMKQLRYQSLRGRAMLKSPGYFNRSLWDTLSGEYYRSFTKKSDYFHIFDYWRWDEKQIEDTLDGEYDWERAPDTQTTWRIGDGTAAFYNYAYYTIAGFTEHDTFRSNQVREGDLTRDEALRLVQEENTPRYPNLKWYLDIVGVDFTHAINTINRTPRLYEGATLPTLTTPSD
ncbi:glucosamine 6-phosphate synthetase [Cryobacterium sp. BB307]|uniref:glucosamine 6-phosphate synthetase n=1 Tax=Cryobacterium sp. BB307 TaxID=2716317 RepID=UPI00144527BD